MTEAGKKIPSGEHLGWYKAWPDQPDSLARCSFWAQAVACRVHAVLDDCGGVSVSKSDAIGSLARLLGVSPNERKMFHSKVRELADEGYISIAEDRLWVPSWAWQQRDKNGNVVDMFAKHATKLAMQKPSQGTPKVDVRYPQGIDKVDVRCDQGIDKVSVRSSDVLSNSLKSLESTSPNQPIQPIKLTQPTNLLSSPESASDVREVFDYWVLKTKRDRSRTKLDSRRERLLRNAVESYGVEACKVCIDGYTSSPHHLGDNSEQKVYDAIDLMFRNADKFDAGIGYAKTYAKTKNHEYHGGENLQIARLLLIWANEDLRQAGDIKYEYTGRFNVTSNVFSSSVMKILNEVSGLQHDGKSFSESIDFVVKKLSVWIEKLEKKAAEAVN